MARHPSEKTYYGIEPPKDTEIPEEDTHFENLTRFFMADENTSAEIKRLRLITEANKIKKYMVPSNTKINAILSDLTAKGYIKYIKGENKTLFFINPDFFDVWEKRQEQLIEEAVGEAVKNTQTTDLKESLKKIAEISKKALNHIDFYLDYTRRFIPKKYGPIIYEFFLLDTAYSDNKESLLILKYKNEIATYTPY